MWIKTWQNKFNFISINLRFLSFIFIENYFYISFNIKDGNDYNAVFDFI